MLAGAMPALLCCATLALGDPGPAAAPDTDVTPTPDKPQAFWHQVGGAKFAETSVPAGSPTPFDADLFSVAFENAKHGFAGGVVNTTCDGQAREVPVIYGYSESATGVGGWTESYRGSCAAPGYVGAIAWRSDGKTAVAVGGSGRFPRREPAYDPADPDGSHGDQAGMARAWLYSGGSWTELDDLPSGMRGLTAIAFDPDATADAGAAGGLGQVFHWENGTFTLADTPGLRYRVRQLSFPGGHMRQAFGVTDGCCGATPADNIPRLLAFDGQHWHVQDFNQATWAQAGDANGSDVNGMLPDSYYGLLSVGAGANYHVSVLATPGGEAAATDRPSVISDAVCVNNAGAVQDLPISTNSEGDPAVEVVRGTNLGAARLLAAGGDIYGGELAGDTLYNQTVGQPDLTHPSPPTVTGGPSDLARPGGFVTPGCGSSFPAGYPGDGIPDWAVGELESADAPPSGHQALVVVTGLRPALVPDTVTPPDAGHPGSVTLPTQSGVNSYTASQQFLLPSYTLNAIAMVGVTGAGWAVGDHGAIMRIGDSAGAARAGREPDPPALGAPERAALADATPYDAFAAPFMGEAGTVPPLAGQPLEQLDAPELVPAGSPDPDIPANNTAIPVRDVQKIVMSRSGNEGWALGPNVASPQPGTGASRLSLYHYDGAAWTRCDASGVRGQLPADRACASLARLESFTFNNGGVERRASVGIRDAARVPLENDDDPSNDDDFEVVAIGTLYARDPSKPGQPAVLRYRDGAWSLEDEAESGAVHTEPGLGIGPDLIAFTAPDDGWMVQRAQPVDPSGYLLYHYDGTRWVDCAQAADHCGDDAGVTSFSTSPNDANGDVDKIAGVATAGNRLWVYGHRVSGDGKHYPMIVYHDRGGHWGHDPAGGGLDPAAGAGRATPDPAAFEGDVRSLAVRALPGGGYDAFAVGLFGGTTVRVAEVRELLYRNPATVLLDLRGGRWQQAPDGGPLHDYLSDTEERLQTSDELRPITTVKTAMTGDGGRLIAQVQTGRLFAYDAGHERWGLVAAQRPYGIGGAGGSPSGDGVTGAIQAIQDDGGGGAWLAVRNSSVPIWSYAYPNVYFFHYTARRPRSVFREVPQPLHGSLLHFTGLAAQPDGSLWLSTSSERLFRYRRATGWDSVAIPGWDPGRIVTRTSEVNAVAVAPDGTGVAVGAGGRIADLNGTSARLDPAAGRSCASGAAAPCGTTYNLQSAAVAPDGSALAGGEHHALVWRPAGASFRAVAAPDVPPSATIVGVALPVPDRAWLVTDGGLVFAGTLSGDGWHWAQENLTADGDLVGRAADGTPPHLTALAIAASGHGFAVGDHGVVLERDGDGPAPWRRVDLGLLDDLTSVALPAGGGPGALIGGHNGLILTLVDGRWAVARAADYFGANADHAFEELTGPVVGLAAVPGARSGQVEAWAVTLGKAGNAGSATSGGVNTETDNGLNQLFHYSSDPSEPLLAPVGRARPLPDAPAPEPGEVRFAVFGNSGCQSPPGWVCPPPNGTTADYEVIAQRVVDEMLGARDRPDAALFTGDTVGPTSLPGSATADETAGPGNIDVNGPVKLRRWNELIGDRFRDAGLPLLGAIGARDLSNGAVCEPEYSGPQCSFGLGGAAVPDTQSVLPAGENLQWRAAMAGRDAPWGGGQAPSGAAQLRPVADAGSPAGSREAPGGGARTHYAVDLVRDGRAVARVVVVDTSLGSLQGTDPGQNPVEPAGQLAWLGRMLCTQGEGCTRGAGEPAVVVSTTPTYSYGPSSAGSTETDATTLEQTLLEDQATAVVSGRLGWNGLYYALAPGLHDPQPGGPYPTAAPTARGSTGGAAGTSPTAAAGRVAASLRGSGPPAAPTPAAVAGAAGAAGAVPFVVSGSAGHPLDNPSQPASAGYWHGYAIVRVAAGGDPAATIVEQRPVFDWIDLTAVAHVLMPGQRMTLHGVGREPAGIAASVPANSEPIPQQARFDDIDSAAITHRYDLVEADPQRPYLPRTDPGGEYVPLDPSVATIDATTGRVIAGRSSHGRVYALALLSVGAKAATFPIVFEPRRSYVPPRLPRVSAPPVPAVRVLGFNAQSLVPPTSAPPASAPPPISTAVNPPSPPALPALPGAGEPAAPPVPPPAPPAPPPGQQPAPLTLSVTPVGIALPPSTGVTAQPTPPVNPSPPSGARREAKQRQAATAKSEEGASDAQRAGVDLANGPESPGGAAFRRRDRLRADGASLTALPHVQPSAWTTGLWWGGGIGLSAVALALAFAGVRPRTRRRPQPSWVVTRRGPAR